MGRAANPELRGVRLDGNVFVGVDWRARRRRHPRAGVGEPDRDGRPATGGWDPMAPAPPLTFDHIRPDETLQPYQRTVLDFLTEDEDR